MTSSNRISSSLCRVCRVVGICGTLAGHAALLIFLWLMIHQADSRDLPLPVESSLIALHVVSAPAPSAPVPETPSTSEAPESPTTPPEPEIVMPIPEPEAEPEIKPALEKAETLPLPKEKPKERPARKAPPSQAQPVRSTPAASPSSEAIVPNASAQAQARQTLLSYLLAQFEKYKHYPATARKLGLEGVVHVAVSVDSRGNLISIQLKDDDTHPVLRKATADTIEKIRNNWRPQVYPHAVSIVVPLRYSLVHR